MESKFIVDQEIKLDENTDFLNTRVYAESLRMMIDRVPSNKSFTIGLFGEWGSGKSSVIKTIREKLEHNTSSPTKFAIFDAWKYNGDAFRRSFILSLGEQLTVELNKYEHNLYENVTEKVQKLKFKIPTIFYITASILLILFGLSYIFFPGFKDFLIKFVAFSSLIVGNSIVALVLVKIYKDDALKEVLSILGDFLYSKYDVEKPLLFSPEQFSKSFGELLSKASPNNERIIIVVDNIDRCEKDYACELLSTIKGFLEHKENVLFILPVDDGALKKHVRDSFKASDRDADEFLRKFFNVNLRIKPYTPVEIFNFAKKINDKYQLQFKDETIDLVSKEFATNPRRIVQMFNNLSSELLCFDANFSKEFETQIAKLLIIREEFPGYYMKVAKNPFILNDNGEESELNKESVNVINFVNKTRVLTEGTAIGTFNKILSNSDIFNELPQEIENYIEGVNLEKITDFIGDDAGKKETVVNYLIKSLHDYADRKLFGTTYINSLDLLVGIDETSPLSIAINTRIEEIVRPNLAEMLGNKKNYLNLISYSKRLFELSRPYLKTFMITHIQEGLNKEDKDLQFHIDAFKKFIDVYDGDESISELSSVYEKMYPLENNIVDIRELTSFQASHLVSVAHKLSIIKIIRSISVTDSALQEIAFLLEHTLNTEEIENEILKQFNILIGDFRGSSREDVLAVLKAVNLVLSKMKFQNGEELTNLFKVLTGVRKIPHPSYASNTSYDSDENNADDLMKDSEGMTALNQLLLQVFRIESTVNDTLSIFQKLLLADGGRKLVNETLGMLVALKMDLSPLKQIILSDNSFDQIHLNLLTYLIEYKNKDGYTLSSEDSKIGLTYVLEHYFNNTESRIIIAPFLEYILENPDMKNILTSDISNRAVNEVMTLPTVLKKTFLDSALSGDKIFGHQNNQPFLEFIASEGEKTHILQLVKLIMSLLQADSTVDQATTLILKTNSFNNRDASRLKNELLGKDIATFDENKLKAAIAHLNGFIS
ncbi:KAP family P-loop NTPase fold protein [Pedobacter sp. MW01-1-1]|uniref:KAP family P-loop NTPase fold protein n=1 Tax=Pedobacter sp. MW01-1-1 TaxID=3383027 RepID=UPI003FEE6467